MFPYIAGRATRKLSQKIEWFVRVGVNDHFFSSYIYSLLFLTQTCIFYFCYIDYRLTNIEYLLRNWFIDSKNDILLFYFAEISKLECPDYSWIAKIFLFFVFLFFYIDLLVIVNSFLFLLLFEHPINIFLMIIKRAKKKPAVTIVKNLKISILKELSGN